MRSWLRRLGFIGLMFALTGFWWFGRPTAAATPPGATQAENLDEGDAPDETNSYGVGMTTYAAAVPARFPTVFSGPAPIGPSHIDSKVYFLGDGVTTELEADIGFDADGISNIDPPANIPDRDRFDDAFWNGLPTMQQFAASHCVPMKLDYRITNVSAPANTKVYVNVWIDWDHSGFWGNNFQCNGALSSEWAVQNQLVVLPGAGPFNLQTTPFLPFVPATLPPERIWLRITASDTPAAAPDGSGPPNRWQLGETEDYQVPFQDPTDPTPTPITDITPTEHPTLEPTKTPVGQPTWTPTERPTEIPTEHPTEIPTLEPTKTPVGQPTWTPTERPTFTPTKTPISDITPTKTPVTQPTWTPTERPTFTPTKTPISDITPTKTPVTQPTWTPTQVTHPTLTPTKTPVTDITPTATHPPVDVLSDLGDAPDSTNSFNVGMTTYFNVVPAQFPTVYNSVAPFGPFHRDTRVFNLGRKVTNEVQADMGFDVDTVNNIRPPANIADQDRADDGLVAPATLSGFKHCLPTRVTYTVTYNGTMPRQVYFNMWSDWNRDGRWGGATQCHGGLSNEWNVNNQVITLMPGLNTFNSPIFLPTNPTGKAALWFRLTVSDTPATAADGSGPAAGWKLGETEDYFLSSDLGDAPDSQNSFWMPMQAYSWPWWIWARYPTEFNRLPAAAPRGPLHHNLGVRYVLGKAISAEAEADSGPDDDPTNNLVVWPDSANRDRADDAFPGGAPATNSFINCQPRTLNYQVSLPNSPPPTGTVQAYVNVWIDYNRNGMWGGAKKCIDSTGVIRLTNEWAVQNQPLTLTGPAVYNLTTPTFVPYNPVWPRPMWLRITISDTPATAADGRGPNAGWAWGETEDYLLRPHLIPIPIDISGTVFTPSPAGRSPLPNSPVHLFVQRPGTAAPVLVGTTMTNGDGHYRFDDLPPGTYFAMARHEGLRPQWFDHADDLAHAQAIALSDTPRNDIDFDLLPPTPPLVEVGGAGTVTHNPDGTFGIIFPRQGLGPVTLIVPSSCMTCPNGLTPSNVRLVVRAPGNPAALATLPLTFNPATNAYNITITPAQLNALFTSNIRKLEFYLVWECGNETFERYLGAIELIDPSGYIRNMRTGQPIEGATVRLFQVPEWDARTAPDDEDADTCESNLSKASGAAWSQPAPTELGVEADPSINLMAPMAGSQVTGASGYYGWDVGPGCWYVIASAPGYAAKISPVVGTPSAVTDLDLSLIEVQTQTYMPVIIR